jgi:hypothetical protein
MALLEPELRNPDLNAGRPTTALIDERAIDESLPEPERDLWVKLSITVERTDGGVVDAELLHVLRARRDDVERRDAGQQLQRLFERWQEILVTSVLNKIKRAVLSNAIALGELPPPPQGINFDNGRWQFGKHLTADTGYDTSANLELLQAGLKSASEIAGEEGYDFEDLIDQMVKEAIIVRDKCAQAGVPVEMVALGRFPDASNQLAAAAAAQEVVQPTASDIGDGALRILADVMEKVSGGLLPRDAVINLLVGIYELDPAVAEAIVPQPQPVAVAANMPPEPKPEGGFGGSDEPAKVDSEEKDK